MVDVHKLKLGTKVKIINLYGGHKFTIGEIVTKYGDEESNMFVNDKGDRWYCLSDCCELVSKLEFKVGDRVRSDDNKEYVIAELKVYSGGDTFARKYVGNKYCSYLTKNLTLVEENCCKSGTWGVVKDYQGYIINNKSNMSNIIKFVKNSLLSADEKLLRKYGLKNECGDYTAEARDLVIDKLVADNNAYLVTQATALQTEEDSKK